MPTKKTKYQTHKTLHKTFSKICQQSKQSIKSITSNKVLSSYTKYLLFTVNKFIKNDNHKHILESIFTIKNKLEGKIEGKHIRKLFLNKPIVNMEHSSIDFELDETVKIPKFIELFQYLLTIPIFNKHFTKEEIDSFHANSSGTRYQIYDYLHNNPIGAKIADIYYKEYNNLILNRCLVNFSRNEEAF
jgi:hypothetical protein